MAEQIHPARYPGARNLGDEQWLRLIELVHDDMPHEVKFPGRGGGDCEVRRTDEHGHELWRVTIKTDGRLIHDTR